jgi:hypothetical protein
MVHGKALRATAEELNEGSIDVDGHLDSVGIRYLGRARRQADGSWRTLANVHGALCVFEVTIKLPTFGSLPGERGFDAPCGVCVCCKKREGST